MPDVHIHINLQYPQCVIFKWICLAKLNLLNYLQPFVHIRYAALTPTEIHSTHTRHVYVNVCVFGKCVWSTENLTMHAVYPMHAYPIWLIKLFQMFTKVRLPTTQPHTYTANSCCLILRSQYTYRFYYQSFNNIPTFMSTTQTQFILS